MMVFNSGTYFAASFDDLVSALLLACFVHIGIAQEEARLAMKAEKGTVTKRAINTPTSNVPNKKPRGASSSKQQSTKSDLFTTIINGRRPT